jgi:thiol-disulfide isomerase/thioredoxin
MWSTTCTACIGAFSKMQSLQEEFKGKVQILLVNPHVSKYDTEDKIMSVLEKLKARTGFCPSLPIPIHDSILNSYFPHQSVPHVVWIDAAGTVTAITGSLDVTNENINSILQKQDINMPVKNDWAFNTEKPLLIDENGGADNDFVFRSLFTKYKGGIGFKSGVRLNNNKEVVGVYMLNKSLRQYIDEAYSDVINGINYNRFVFEVKDPTRFSESFNRENIYCYDLTVAPTAMQKFDVSAFLKEDLKRAFNISVQKSTRKLKCIAITATDKIKRHFSKYDVRQVDLSVSSIRKYMHHVSIEEAIKYIDRFDAPLVLDDTGITGNIDINFPENINLSNRLDILSFLRKIGFHVKEEERELSVIIITDK